MTQTFHVPSRLGVFADAELALTTYAAALRKAFARYVQYRRTLSDLKALSMRQREDMGFADSDMAEIARAATRLN